MFIILNRKLIKLQTLKNLNIDIFEFQKAVTWSISDLGQRLIKSKLLENLAYPKLCVINRDCSFF